MVVVQGLGGVVASWRVVCRDLPLCVFLSAAAVAAGPWSSQSGAGPAWEAEAADHQLRSSIAAERRRREGEDDTAPSQHWDLAYCLWLVGEPARARGTVHGFGQQINIGLKEYRRLHSNYP